MNEQQQPLSSTLVKLGARRIFSKTMRFCLPVSLMIFMVQTLGDLTRSLTGGTLNFYPLEAAAYSTQTGLFFSEGSVLAVLRLDIFNLLYGLPIAYAQLPRFFLSNLLIFLVTTPLLYGALEVLSGVIGGRPPVKNELFRWYADLRLTGKSLGMNLLLTLLDGLVRLLCFAPAFLLTLQASRLGDEGFSSFTGASWAFILGYVLSQLLYSLISPARYLLVQEPDRPVAGLLAEGFSLLRGRRMPYFLLRLSFSFLGLLAALLSGSLTMSGLNSLALPVYGVLSLYLFPYAELSNLLYVQMASGKGSPLSPAPPPMPEV